MRQARSATSRAGGRALRRAVAAEQTEERSRRLHHTRRARRRMLGIEPEDTKRARLDRWDPLAG